ncbi:Mur ligase family protein [Peribacillus kribbensis]|uniref:Mur ligase family protein n=1 Tax=Peribacillus kribbensis TaxID=356658 RepID=UPI0003FBDA69|nr:UDP-N-acetylmuramoyl-tripeptide--D-alanyl-D-alanine ligase [Peribacillus kribbensis]
MKPMIVSEILPIIDGQLTIGSEKIEILYGAYRLKQIKRSNTIFFLRKSVKLVDLNKLNKYAPLVIVTEHFYDNVEDENLLAIIKVNDIEAAFWKFIRFYRNQFQIPIVAVTGTSGKTTTKEMIKHILRSKLNVQATGFSNNSRTAHISYLLGIDESTEVAVFETAVGQPGDISHACQYFQPTMGVITNIGSHHLNTCRTKEGYIKAKGELIDSLPDEGVLFLNFDDENTRKLSLANFSGRVVTFGLTEHAQYQATNIRYSKNGMEYTLNVGTNQYDVYVPGFGENQVYNSLAALAVANEIGVSLPDGINQLTSFKNLPRHLEQCRGIKGSTILDDSWNITSTSLESAVKVLNELSNGRKRILVIDSMTDLGAWGIIMQMEVGKIICHYGVDILITIGWLAGKTGSYVAEQEIGCEVHMFDDFGYSLAYNLLVEKIDENSLILLKGDMVSRGMKRLVAKLKEKKGSD